MRLIGENRWIVHVYDGMKLTALHWAAKRDNPQLVRTLIRYGCFIDGKDAVGRTPLFLAARNDSINSLKELVKHNASPYTKS